MDGSGTATISKSTRTRKGNKDDIAANGFIRLAPKTHDSSLAGEHIPNVKYLAEDLEAAVHGVWPRRHEFRYLNVQVLLVDWQDDDLGVAKEVTELQNVFEDLYHYDVQVYRIPSAKPDKALKRRMVEFLDNDGEETLLILYYAGHAKKSPQSSEAPIWFANRKPKSPYLPSGGIQSLMEEADSDALLLYDCCNAAATTTSESQHDQRGVTEVIAACGYESVAPEVGEHSFTNALTQILATVSKGVPCSIGDLHNRILNRLKCWVPNVAKDKNGKMKEDIKGGLEYERQPRRTPIYSILCDSKPRRSILLAPFRKAIVDHDDPGPGAQFVNTDINEFRYNLKRKRSPPPKEAHEKCSQVILSVQLHGNELDIPAWRECIRSFPAEARDIKIEGIYESFSTLLLVRMPVAIWDLLPENPAYGFIGYVTSENQATTKLLAQVGRGAPTASATTTEPPRNIGVLKCAACRRFRQKCLPVDPNINERTWIEGGQQDRCARCVQNGYPCSAPEYPQSTQRPRSIAIRQNESANFLKQIGDPDSQGPVSSGLRNFVEVKDTSAPLFPPMLRVDWKGAEVFSLPTTPRPLSPPHALISSEEYDLYSGTSTEAVCGSNSLSRSMSAASARSYISPIQTRPSSPQHIGYSTPEVYGLNLSLPRGEQSPHPIEYEIAAQAFDYPLEIPDSQDLLYTRPQPDVQSPISQLPELYSNYQNPYMTASAHHQPSTASPIFTTFPPLAPIYSAPDTQPSTLKKRASETLTRFVAPENEAAWSHACQPGQVPRNRRISEADSTFEKSNKMMMDLDEMQEEAGQPKRRKKRQTRRKLKARVGRRGGLKDRGLGTASALAGTKHIQAVESTQEGPDPEEQGPRKPVQDSEEERGSSKRRTVDDGDRKAGDQAAS